MPVADSLNPSTAARGHGFADPKALMAIRNLELRARVVVEGFWNGLHRSPYHGFSVEFTEYRQYSPGDDTRYLDWRLYARTDRYYLKRFEDETNLRCHLLVDHSRSMDYGSVGYSKSDYVRTLAATLAWFLHGQGDAVGLISFDERVREYLPARHRSGHLRQLMLALEHQPEGRETNLGEPLRRVAELARKRGLIVLLSDLLTPLDQLERSLARLTAAGHEVVLFQALDPNELAFAFQRPVLFQDLESGQDVCWNWPWLIFSGVAAGGTSWSAAASRRRCHHEFSRAMVFARSPRRGRACVVSPHSPVGARANSVQFGLVSASDSSARNAPSQA
jgi:hypothetical protein